MSTSDAITRAALRLLDTRAQAGAARALERPRHWRRSIGRLVDVQPVDRTTHGRSFEARVLEVQGEQVTLQRSTQVKKGMPIKLQDPETWDLSQIKQARVRVED